MSRPLSPQAQAVRRDFAQIMKAMHPYTDVKVSVSDFALPIKIDGYRVGIEAGVNALVAAALRAAADQVVPEWPADVGNGGPSKIIRFQLLAIAAELEAGG